MTSEKTGRQCVVQDTRLRVLDGVKMDNKTKRIREDFTLMRSMQQEIIELRKLVKEWRKAFARFTSDDKAFLDCFHEVLNKTDKLHRSGKLKTRKKKR